VTTGGVTTGVIAVPAVLSLQRRVLTLCVALANLFGLLQIGALGALDRAFGGFRGRIDLAALGELMLGLVVGLRRCLVAFAFVPVCHAGLLYDCRT
jgi:hypothetical protein